MDSLKNFDENINKLEEDVLFIILEVFPDLKIQRWIYKSFYELDLYFEIERNGKKNLKINIESDWIYHYFTKIKDYKRDLNLKDRNIDVVRLDILDDMWKKSLECFLNELKNDLDSWEEILEAWWSIVNSEFDSIEEDLSVKVSECDSLWMYLIYNKKIPSIYFNDVYQEHRENCIWDLFSKEAKILTSVKKKKLNVYLKTHWFNPDNVFSLIDSIGVSWSNKDFIMKNVYSYMKDSVSNKLYISEISEIILKILVDNWIDSTFYFDYISKMFENIERNSRSEIAFYEVFVGYFEFFVNMSSEKKMNNLDFESVLVEAKKYKKEFDDFCENNKDDDFFSRVEGSLHEVKAYIYWFERLALEIVNDKTLISDYISNNIGKEYTVIDIMEFWVINERLSSSDK